MRALLLITVVILMQACGQLANNGAKMCDGVRKNLSPINFINNNDAEKANEKPPAKGDQTLLMYRMLNSL